MKLTAQDDVCRDLKKELLALVPDESPSRARHGSDPSPARDHVTTVSDIAKPGGFRRNFLADQGMPVHHFPPLVQQVLPIWEQLLDPNLALPQCVRHPSSATGGASNVVTVLTLVKTFLTGTLLVIPAGFREAGLLGGCIILVGVACLEVYCLLVLVRCRATVGSGTYSDLATALGKYGPSMVMVMLVASEYGFVCAEQVYVAENMLKCFQPIWPQLRQWHFLFLFQLVLVPMSWVRKLKFYAVTNLVGNGMIIVCVAYLIAFGVSRLNANGAAPDLRSWGSPNGSLLFFGNCVYFYEGINMILPIYESHGKKGNFENILLVVLAMVSVLFVGFGLLWYTAFGDDVASLASLNLPPESSGAKFIPPVYAIACLFTTPVLFFPIAQIVEPRLFPYGEWQNALTRKWCKNFFRAVLMVLSALIAAVGGQKLQNFIAIIGALCCGPLAIALPAALHLKICDAGGVARAIDCGVFVVGVSITVFSTSAAIASWK